MNLHKRLLLLQHLNNFINEQQKSKETTEDILAMLNYKSEKYFDQIKDPNMIGVRRTYVETYGIMLKKRIIDFEYFRKKKRFRDTSDNQIFNLIDFRDKIIYNKFFKD